MQETFTFLFRKSGWHAASVSLDIRFLGEASENHVRQWFCISPFCFYATHVPLGFDRRAIHCCKRGYLSGTCREIFSRLEPWKPNVYLEWFFLSPHRLHPRCNAIPLVHRTRQQFSTDAFDADTNVRSASHAAADEPCAAVVSKWRLRSVVESVFAIIWPAVLRQPERAIQSIHREYFSLRSTNLLSQFFSGIAFAGEQSFISFCCHHARYSML